METFSDEDYKEIFELAVDKMEEALQIDVKPKHPLMSDLDDFLLFEKSVKEKLKRSVKKKQTLEQEKKREEKTILRLKNITSKINKKSKRFMQLQQQRLKDKEELLSDVSFLKKDLNNQQTHTKNDIHENLEKYVGWYKSQLGLNIISLNEEGFLKLYFLNLVPDLQQQATVTFCIHHNRYKLIETNPPLDANILSKCEDVINQEDNFQGFLCFLRRQFTGILQNKNIANLT